MKNNGETAAYGDLNVTKTTLVSRNITVQGRRTSVRLEPQMWVALREVAALEQCTIHDVCTLVSVRKKENTSLTAAIRVFVMLYFRAASTEEGHRKVGHGDFERMKQRARVPQQLGEFFSQKRAAPASVKNVIAKKYSYSNDGYRNMRIL